MRPGCQLGAAWCGNLRHFFGQNCALRAVKSAGQATALSVRACRAGNGPDHAARRLIQIDNFADNYALRE